MFPSVVFVITCMGRAFHLKQTLPLYLAQDYPNYKVLIVDWSSPDDLEEYLSSVKDPNLLKVKVLDKQYFCLSKARNVGGDYLIEQKISPDYLAFFDADVKLPFNFLSLNIALTQKSKNCFLQRNKTLLGDLSIWGSCIVPFQAWKDIRYNEEIDSYGEEDNEFYNVLQSRNYMRLPLQTAEVEIIQHSDDLRMQFYKGTARDIPRFKRANKKKFRVS
jgi:glycosyltransferase involved in cell wall biosynthesis